MSDQQQGQAMTSKTDHPDAAQHQGDIATSYADANPNAADARARGAADRMWQKVEEDLEQIDRIDADDSDETEG